VSEPAVVYRFGRFRVDTREQRLTRDGVVIPLTPRVFDTLVVFLRHPGRLLTKSELLQAVWHDAAVEEANLTVNVSTLRRLLGAIGDPPCIETVSRRGYRFVAPVAVDPVPQVTAARPRRHAPATVRAQELFARANQAAYEADHWETARDLYQACIEEDPGFAPAWAHLGRCHHLIGKFTAAPALRDFARAQAEAAFKHAMTLDEALPLTHRLCAQMEVDLGHASDAAVRLLRVVQRTGPDAAVFAGLVHALRFCGLLVQSRRAHERARALEPTIVTSVSHTYWLLGEYERALKETTGDIGYMPGLALASLGRDADAIAALRWRERDTRDNRARAFLVSLRALLEGNREESLRALDRAADELTDPEAMFYIARTLARLSAQAAAIAALERVVEGGYFCYPAFATDSWFDGVRGVKAFKRIADIARDRHELARRAWLEAGGDAVLAARTPDGTDPTGGTACG
jgi:DNA-binding winged helix-turn-helix (wHTH) protein